MSGITIPIAFVAGIAAFLSPCILPIVPGFLAYLGGTTAENAAGSRRETFLNSVFFVLGFALVFSVAGILLQTVLLHSALVARVWMGRVGGIIIVIFGLYLAKILPLPFLDREYKFRVFSGVHSRYVTSFLFGAAFAAGWTPCVGAILGAILTLAIVQPGSAFALLLAFTLGIGIPFLLVGAFAALSQTLIARYARQMEYVSIAFGVVLVILGVLVFTQQLPRIVEHPFLNRFLLTAP